MYGLKRSPGMLHFDILLGWGNKGEEMREARIK